MHQEQLQQPYPLGGAPLSQRAALALLPAITLLSGEGLLEPADTDTHKHQPMV